MNVEKRIIALEKRFSPIKSGTSFVRISTENWCLTLGELTNPFNELNAGVKQSFYGKTIKSCLHQAEKFVKNNKTHQELYLSLLLEVE